MSRPAHAAWSSLQDTTEIIGVLIGYLEGHHYGDMEKLRSATVSGASTWHPSAPGSRGVAPVHWPAPADQGESFSYRILSLDVHGDHAVALVSGGSLIHVRNPVELRRAEGAWRVDTRCPASAPRCEKRWPSPNAPTPGSF